MINRRRLLTTSATLGSVVATAGLLPAWAKSSEDTDLSGLKVLSGKAFELSIRETPVLIDGRGGDGVTINDQLPAPLLRWQEGDEIELRVTNYLREDTSIHWHGILLPFQMDGVPGVTFPGIRPGETFTYKFPISQAGTYWYHSHSGLQEQSGHYGPIIIEPKGKDPVAYDKEYIVVLSDWTFENPHRVFSKLKKMSDAYNFQQRTLGDFARDVSANGFSATVKDRATWGRMRMSPTDISDVTGSTYTYLINGHGPEDNWTGLFEPGQRIRLRFVNASAMSIFNVRIPGLPMTVVQADGLNVQPVEIDEFQIGTAETYDVVVQPQDHQAFTLMCEANDRSGYVRATLAPQAGMTASVPPLRSPPLLTMKDMGMASHGDHDMSGSPDMKSSDMKSGAMDHSKMNHGDAKPAKPDHSSMNHGAQPAPKPGGMDHSKMNHDAMGHGTKPATPDKPAASMGNHDTGMKDMPVKDMGMQDMGSEMGQMQMHDHPTGAGVVNTAMNPINRLGEPGVGLEDVSHRVLVYTDLKSLEPNPDMRPPGREVELHLTSNMERYMWSFDGIKFSEVDGPIVFYKDERLRLTMVNDTMMPHPIHLHGMFFDVVTGDHNHKPRKHTIVVKPGEKLSVDITADALGDWAFHCHLLYHMHAGMFRVVSVRNSHEEHGS
jgi:CopA family copper-resistance protein